jgi:hypothetical protein
MTWVAAGMGGVALATSVYKGYQGNKREKEAKDKLSRLQKPEYVIPQEIKDNLTEAEARSLEGLPASQKKEYIQNLERSQTAAMQESGNRKGGLIGVQNAIQTSNNAYNELVSKDAVARENNRNKVAGARTDLANEKLRKQASEKLDYQNELSSIQGDLGASIQQQNEAFDSGTAAVISTAGTIGTNTGGGNRTKKKPVQGDNITGSL